MRYGRWLLGIVLAGGLLVRAWLAWR